MDLEQELDQLNIRSSPVTQTAVSSPVSGPPGFDVEGVLGVSSPPTGMDGN